MTEVEIVHNGDCPRITDDQFLNMLAQDVEVLDTTPADTTKETVRWMPELATAQFLTFPGGDTWVGSPDEAIIGPSELLFHG